ncbi:hypothetical protein CTAYLR_003897 [Chrysophaeum taylorii]|uniref:Cation efflux protein transmembrane domain-containing protein n=1 Tax=Chrysophaeum taylorii TaxID=2483200 RepID=A0AAD7XQA5_9STRA|nr:hypothetical protein CTAYLR_003897 [Chrysophaeum taylorii]
MIERDEESQVLEASSLKRGLLAGLVDEPAITKLSRPVRRFQRRQNALIRDLMALEEDVSQTCASRRPASGDSALIAVRVSFGSNIALLLCKVAAFGLSGSLVVLASAVDSLLDLISGFMLFWVQRALPSDRLLYPPGVGRVEPAGVLAFSVGMGMASLQIMVEAGRVLVRGLMEGPHRPSASPLVIGILVLTIVAKLALCAYCATVVDSPAVDAYRDDHRNDAASNAFGLAALLLATLGPQQAWIADPVGAAALAACLLVSWSFTAVDQINRLVGRTADPEFLQRLTYIALVWAPEDIQAVDTVRAYHFGLGYLCEIDVVLKPDLPLKQAHDIGQALQDFVESLDDVERAFVHLDWETTHNIEHSGTPSLPRPHPR